MEDLIWRYQLLVSLLLVMICSSCKKEETKLPPLTHEGRNTFGYIRSGGSICGGEFNSDDQVVWLNQTELLISYKNVSHIHMWQTESVEQVNLYFHWDNITTSFVFLKAEYVDYLNQAQLDDVKNNTCELTYHNPDRRILSGIFDLNFIEQDTVFSSDSIPQIVRIDTLYMQHLYKGRFDVKYPD